MSKAKFNQDMTIGEILYTNPNAEVVLMGFGMHCCGCPVSQMETLAEAAQAHDADVNEILSELNAMPEFTGCDCGCDGECGSDCDCGCQD